MGIARNIARLIPNGSGLLPNANIEAMAASKLTGSVALATQVSGTLPDANAPSGSVIQAVQSDTTGIVSFTDSDGTFITASITPSQSSSRVFVSGYYIWGADNPNGYFALERSINGGSWTSLSHLAGYDEVAANGNGWSAPVDYIDSPNTTLATSYRIRWYHVGRNGGTMYMNRSFTNDANTLNTSRTGRTVLILQEIA